MEDGGLQAFFDLSNYYRLVEIQVVLRRLDLQPSLFGRKLSKLDLVAVFELLESEVLVGDNALGVGGIYFAFETVLHHEFLERVDTAEIACDSTGNEKDKDVFDHFERRRRFDTEESSVEVVVGKYWKKSILK